ncbi:MAG: mcP1 [Myxococcaceae bacterium]|nr:mcP1 [Myxococcaceae bacterium]
MSAGLQGLHRWVTTPSAVSGLLGASVAVLYAFFTIDLPAGTLTPLFLCLGIFATLALLAGHWQEQRGLQTVKKLAAAAGPPHKEHLSEAVRELAQLPDLTFWVTLGCWVAGAVGIALSYAQATVVDWQIAARLAFLGVALGPLVATLSYLQVVTRTRTAIGRVAAAGLSAQDVIAAIPPVRMQLQRRLMIYAAVAVGTPLMLVTDMVVRRTEQVFARVLAQPNPAAQTATLSAELGAGGWGLILVWATVLAVVVICAYLSGSALGAPMRALAEKTRAIAAGKLGGSGLVPSEDEIWGAAAGFTSLEAQLVGVVTQLQEAGQKIQRTTDELGSSRAKHDRGANDQTAALAQTSATTEELARSAKQIAGNATQVAALASQTLDAARTGKNNADQFYVSILKVREGNQAIADSVVKLNKRVQQVGRIVEFIDGIADKSDLLALNAELEGNKAGEVGRGFSLVAAEMRRLAESVMGSTREIIGLIHEVRDATNAAVMATEAGVKASDKGSALARKVSEGLSDILTYATTTADAVQRITLATHQQEVGTDQLAQAMADILQSTKAGQGASKKMSTANADLQALATELKLTVGRFEVS